MTKDNIEGTQEPRAEQRTATQRQASYAKKRRQAVVVIHGMGEQTPLGTLKDFVRSVYQRDLKLTKHEDARIHDPEIGEINRVWMVPDDTTGSAELRRITTATNKNDIITDFYEFYWADIMHSNPLDLVMAWIRGLLLRSPLQLPKDLRVVIAWVLLWMVTTAFLFFSWSLAAPNGGPLAGILSALAGILKSSPETIIGMSALWPSVLMAIGLGIIVLTALFSATTVLRKYELGMALILEGGALFYLLQQMSNELPPSLAGLIGLGLAATGVFFLLFRLGMTHPIEKTAFLLPLVLMVAGGALLIAPVEAYLNAKTLAGAFAAITGAFATGFLAPYLGDVVRYTNIGTATVAKREAVRTRGLQLLRNLHNLPEEGASRSSKRDYERIIVVAHSLGSMLAYDLLLHLWEEIGPNHKRPDLKKSKIEASLKSLDEQVVQKTWTTEFSDVSALSQKEFDALDFDGKQKTGV